VTTPPRGAARLEDDGGLLDALVLPDGLPRTDGPRAEGPRGGARGATWRGAGAALLWGLLQGAFLFVAPPLAIALNLALVGLALWWFVARPLAGARRAERPARWRAATLRLRPLPPRAAPWLAVAALALVLAAALSLAVVPRFIPVPLDRDNPLVRYLARPLGAVAVFVAAVGVAPLLEELLFRGWMQRTLERRVPVPVAIGATALAFAAVHLEAFGFPLRAALGTAAGVAAWSTRSIWPAVTLHATYNGALLLASGAVPGVDERTLTVWANTDRIFWPALGGLLAAAGVAWWALARMRRAARR
jgi:hypothetical protein